MELDPENPRCVNHYGFCLARVGRFEESLAVFRTEGNEAKAHYQLARMLNHLGKVDLCKQHLEAALRIEPRFTEAELMLVQLERLENGAPAKDVTPVNYETVAPQGPDKGP